MLSVITSLEFFQHYFAKMGHRNPSCDPHLHQAIEQPMLPTSREASAARAATSKRINRRYGIARENALADVRFRPLKSLGAHRTVLPAFVFHATGWTVTCCCIKLLTRTEALCETFHTRARQIPPAEHFF